jgi:hypothetical protein
VLLSRAVRAPAARHFRAGDVRADGPGTVLRCLVLVPGPDWVAVDLETGALLRAPASFETSADTRPGAVKPGRSVGSSADAAGEAAGDAYGDGDGDGGAGDGAGDAGDEASDAFTPEWPQRSLEAVQLTLGVETEPPDPARPEAVVLAGRAAPIGEPRRRTTRKLLHRLVSKGNDRPLLGTLGPSISYADLDGTRPSVVIVAPQARPRFGVGPAGPWCQFLLGGRRHTMPMAEGAAPDASVNAHGTKLLVVALGAPRRGQVPKIVLGTLPLTR